MNNRVLARWFQDQLQQRAIPASLHADWIEDFLLLVADPARLSHYLQDLFPQEARAAYESEVDAEFSRASLCACLYGDESYPRALENLPYAPFLLSFLGTPTWNQAPCLAVVGSREPSRESVQWMEENLPPLLQATEVLLVSGAARGVDQKAHEISVRLRRPTVAVLPSGLGEIYPENFRPWQNLILEQGGALLSEYRFEERMQKHFFAARNRLISGLSVATLIVQADRRSGTLLTARSAIEQGRPVFVIPSHPLQIRHTGSLDLLMEGATPVRDWRDLKMLLEAEVRPAEARLKEEPQDE